MTEQPFASKDPGSKPSVAHPAASVILLRPASAGFEVLMLLRAGAIKFAGATWVFPGGRIEDSDAPAGDRFTLEAAKSAAARECREEAGLQLATDSMIYYSHWTTPAESKKRFATWFVLDTVAEDQAVLIDDHEIVEYRWLTPDEALQQHVAGDLKLMPPAYITLLELQQCATMAAARTFASEREVPQILPRTTTRDDVFYSLYAEDIAYASKDLSLDGPKHRIVLGKSGWEYIKTC
ncbi:MAG: NUDIX hydrolase [Gammaproteobacteria bacterium]|uniref:NUDIX hydrolase n=1 Tax=Pseudomaricurvus alcaniphilus TaxID=1166482 RepID=UPI001408D2F7|nr:NUDIX hydrolase [Pseudomaricurvus alcaniphilus]MBR9911882.1 NUDIX hydrolase [Gammaproteobacteria bacterium]NHN36067.1 NUDIX hydrolase [Pseudomaricurvus alcaniphilus]